MIDETDERLKITIPIKRSKGYLALFSSSMIIWIGMLIVVLVYLVSRSDDNLILTAILIGWLIIWFWFGRFLWTRWQFFAASREILFIETEQLILRRPVSIFGLTTVYDRAHIGRFYISDRHHCPTFDYAYLHVYFGISLAKSEAESLVAELNARMFPIDEGLEPGE